LLRTAFSSRLLVEKVELSVSVQLAPPNCESRLPGPGCQFIFHVHGLAGAPSVFQAGWSDCIYFFSFLFVRFTCLSGISE
jgi:hypothetical protein